MTHDQQAIRDARGWVAQDGSCPKRHPALIKKLDRIARRRGLTDRTRDVIRYAIEKLEAGWYGHASTILREEGEKLK